MTKSVSVGVGDENSKKVMTTTMGTGNNNKVTDAATAKENHAVEKDVPITEKKGCGICIAKCCAKLYASKNGRLTFTECANHPSAIVSKLSDYHQLNRKVSATEMEGVKPKRIRGGGRTQASLAAKRKGIKESLTVLFWLASFLTGRKCQMRTSKVSSWTPGRRTRHKAWLSLRARPTTLRYNVPRWKDPSCFYGTQQCNQRWRHV